MYLNNVYKNGYLMDKFCKCYFVFKVFIILVKSGQFSIDFVNFVVVKVLNIVLFVYYYNMIYWDIFVGYLCLLVLGRVDYLYGIVDLFQVDVVNKVLRVFGSEVKGLDIGVGVNVIYFILGSQLFGW